ncbi:MAG: FmdB family zinc ribbon protein [Candidatus Dormibacteria bacterium]
MPTYAYRCDSGHEFEIVQPITSEPLSACSACAAPVRRMVFPVGIVFKGQGFYKTDSRSSSTGSIGPAPAAGSSETHSGEASTATKTEPATTTDVKSTTKKSTPSVPTATGGAVGAGGKDG